MKALKDLARELRLVVIRWDGQDELIALAGRHVLATAERLYFDKDAIPRVEIDSRTEQQIWETHGESCECGEAPDRDWVCDWLDGHPAVTQAHQNVSSPEAGAGDVAVLVLRVSEPEHSTILAALRLYQCLLGSNAPLPPGILEIAGNMGSHHLLSADQLDALCQKINAETSAEGSVPPARTPITQVPDKEDGP